MARLITRNVVRKAIDSLEQKLAAQSITPRTDLHNPEVADRLLMGVFYRFRSYSPQTVDASRLLLAYIRNPDLIISSVGNIYVGSKFNLNYKREMEDYAKIVELNEPLRKKYEAWRNKVDSHKAGLTGISSPHFLRMIHQFCETYRVSRDDPSLVSHLRQRVQLARDNCGPDQIRVECCMCGGSGKYLPDGWDARPEDCKHCYTSGHVDVPSSVFENYCAVAEELQVLTNNPVDCPRNGVEPREQFHYYVVISESRKHRKKPGPFLSFLKELVQ